MHILMPAGWGPVSCLLCLLGGIWIITRQPGIVASIGCGLSLYTIVLGPEQGQVPVSVWIFDAIRGNYFEFVAGSLIGFTALISIPTVGLLIAPRFSHAGLRVLLTFCASLVLWGVWLSYSGDWLSSIPMWACLFWRNSIEANEFHREYRGFRVRHG